MLERFLTQSSGGGREDMDYLLEKMDRLGASAPPPIPDRAFA